MVEADPVQKLFEHTSYVVQKREKKYFRTRMNDNLKSEENKRATEPIDGYRIHSRTNNRVGTPRVLPPTLPM